ncbi:hypothetical protein AX16_008879 [Volvariella volvacea WC 439]|nr:hypothetical protein AX16_008879 [Volvariella volvacea WC 439]
MTIMVKPIPIHMPSFIEQLPVELIVHILEFLEAPTLTRCKQISRRFSALIEESVTLQYKISLHAANMIDGPPSEYAKATRLRMLQDHQEAWHRFNWIKQTNIHLSAPEVSLESAWEFLGGVLGLAAGQRLRFIQVPSQLREIEDKQWVIEDIGYTIKDFGMDANQDLLTILEIFNHNGLEAFRLHLCKLSDGNDHHLAHKPIFEYSPKVDFGEWWYVIQIHGSRVAVMRQNLGEGESELVVYDWRSGETKRVFLGYIHSYSFLDENHLLLAVDWNDPPGPTLSIEVVAVTGTIGGMFIQLQKGQSICAFEFPQLRLSEGQEAPELSIRTDHTTQAIHNASSCLHEYHKPFMHRTPFSTSPEDRILVISTSATLPEDKSMVLFVTRSCLMSKLMEVGTKYRPGYIFPWESWGPMGTRIITNTLSDVWFCYVHGMKVLVPLPETQELQLYDFNPRAARQDGLSTPLSFMKNGKLDPDSTINPCPVAKAAPTSVLPAIPESHESQPQQEHHRVKPILKPLDEDMKTTFLNRPSIFVSKLFEKPVETSLPCRIDTFKLSVNDKSNNGYMLGEDSIIIVPAEDDEFIMLSF